MVAEYLLRNHPGDKLLVLDATAQIRSKREQFEVAWKRLGPVLEHLPNVQLQSIETRSTSPVLRPAAGPAVRADGLDLIPPQSAPAQLQPAFSTRDLDSAR